MVKLLWLTVGSGCRAGCGNNRVGMFRVIRGSLFKPAQDKAIHELRTTRNEVSTFIVIRGRDAYIVLVGERAGDDTVRSN